MWLVTEPDGSEWVTECEEITLKNLVRVSEGTSYREIPYLCTNATKKRMWDARAELLEATDLDATFPDRRSRKYPKDPAIAQAIKELEEEGW